MITGYNTDIEYEGVVYHVQTEDKGLSSPVIMSLIYDRGTILASKRAPYEDLINGTLDEEALAERLQRQHKLLCAAISAGRIEDLKQMSARNLKSAAAAKKNGKKKSKVSPAVEQVAVVEVEAETINRHDQVEIVTSEPEVIWPEPDSQAPDLSDAPDIKAEAASTPIWPEGDAATDAYIPETIPYFRLEDVLDRSTDDVPPIMKPASVPLPTPVTPVKPITEQPIAEVPVSHINIINDEPLMVPIEAVQAVSDLAGIDRPESNKLNIDIIGETRFKGGEEKEVCVMVCRGSNRRIIPRADIMIKILGSDFRPVIYHATTDKNGIATVRVKVPQFSSGRASMIARAISDGEEVEVRSAVAHG